MKWFAAQTHPNRDAFARDELRRQAFAVMMPTMLCRRLVHGAIVIGFRPLFVGYLFIGCDLDNDRWQAINSTRGVKRLVMSGANPIPLRQDVVDLVAADCERSMEEPQAVDFLDKLVRVTGGPFASWIGGCVALEKRAAVVMLSILGAPRPVRVPLEQLELAGD